MEKQKPLTEAEFENLLDKASEPLEPEQTNRSITQNVRDVKGYLPRIK